MSSHNLFVSPIQATNLLRGYWKRALAVEGVVLFCYALQILLWVLWVNAINQTAVGCVLFLWTDLLLISPLKAGRALFYTDIVKQKRAVRFSRLFFFFKKSYRRTVQWRLRLWVRRYGLWFLALLPCSALLFWNRYLKAYPVLSLIAFLLAIFWGLFSVILTEIRLLRYIAAVYLLPHHLPFKEVFELSQTIFGKQLNRLANFYVIYGWSWLLPPLFYTARAATVNKMMREFTKQPLQHWKNRGKILSELYDILEEI